MTETEINSCINGFLTKSSSAPGGTRRLLVLPSRRLVHPAADDDFVQWFLKVEY